MLSEPEKAKQHYGKFTSLSKTGSQSVNLLAIVFLTERMKLLFGPSVFAMPWKMSWLLLMLFSATRAKQNLKRYLVSAGQLRSGKLLSGFIFILIGKPHGLM